MTESRRPTQVVATEEDRFYDFIFLEYAPRKDHVGKLRSVELLYQTFDVANCGEGFYSLVDVLQRALGENRTVWGVKKERDRIWWELYWYNADPATSPISIHNVLDAIPRMVSKLPGLDARRPDYMFSLDISPAFLEESTLDQFHVYVQGLIGPTVVNYRYSPEGYSLENHYFRFEALRDFHFVKQAVKNSVHLDFEKMRIDAVLIPELINCRRIWTSFKQQCDGIYYSGLGVGQLQFFLEQHEYPAPLVEFVRESRPALDHLEFDVGFDYRMSEGQLAIVKSSFYGTF